jgi:ClpA/ClpB-like protein
MFERYTEKARRVIFFARYEASQFGSPLIESEHVLLAILRETANVRKMLPLGAAEGIRAQIEARTQIREKVSTSVDLPLSDASKRILKYGMEEAERLNHRHIGSEHLFLGLLREKGCLAAELLEPFGVKLEQFRTKIETVSANDSAEVASQSRFGRPHRIASGEMVEIHGAKRNADYVRDVVSMIRSYNWHWHKTTWKPRDIVVNRNDGKYSFELSLAADSKDFMLVKQGWKKDHCFICRWELFECDDEHGTAYTNGRNWLCTECCERFIQHDYFSSSHPEIT